MELERSSGILLDITSLPSKYGIGDFGPEAFKFIDFLVETKQKLWQILPLSTINCPSPYSCNRILKILFYLIKKNKLVLRSINIWWKFLVNFT
jgi:4-alpha-glucanotransferase